MIKKTSAYAMLLFILTYQVQAAPALPTCPGLDKDNHRLPLTSPQVKQATTSEEDVRPVPSEIAISARKAIGHFESGGGDAYISISDLDTVSIGYLQWNWGTGSLIDIFVAALSDEHIALAMQPLQDDLIVLKRYQRLGNVGREAADRVIRSWTQPSSSDPLIKGVRSSVRAQLSAWLGEQGIRSVQDQLIEPKIRLAHSFARRWLIDSKDIGGNSGGLKETTISFFDLLTYNSGRQGLWVPHVRDFRKQFKSNEEIVNYIADWTISCEDVVKPTYRDAKMYNASEAARNARLWKERLASNSNAFTDNQTNLLIFGYLRALLSNGANPPRGFPGIFQADVMLRRGAVSLGIGTVRGVSVKGLIE